MAESSSHPDSAQDLMVDLESDEVALETHEVDPEGDIYLEIENSLILVSSKVLSLASPVFSTMLNSHFRERLAGQQGLEKPRITLQEDDAPTMELICRVLHHCADNVPEVLEEDMIVEIVEHCDKYDCAAPLKAWVTTWIWGTYHGLDESDRGSSGLLLAAYVFDRAKAFSVISMSVIMHQDEPFTWLPILSSHDLVEKGLPGNKDP